MGYFRDGLNPRGAEYSATARAAHAAEQTQQAMDDMLDLAMAPTEEARERIAAAIKLRRRRERQAATARRQFKYAALALLALFCAGVYELGDNDSSLSHAYNAFMSSGSPKVAPHENAAVRQVRAPDDV